MQTRINRDCFKGQSSPVYAFVSFVTWIQFLLFAVKRSVESEDVWRENQISKVNWLEEIKSET